MNPGHVPFDAHGVLALVVTIRIEALVRRFLLAFVLDVSRQGTSAPVELTAHLASVFSNVFVVVVVFFAFRVQVFVRGFLLEQFGFA